MKTQSLIFIQYFIQNILTYASTNIYPAKYKYKYKNKYTRYIRTKYKYKCKYLIIEPERLVHLLQVKTELLVQLLVLHATLDTIKVKFVL